MQIHDGIISSNIENVTKIDKSDIGDIKNDSGGAFGPLQYRVGFVRGNGYRVRMVVIN